MESQRIQILSYTYTADISRHLNQQTKLIVRKDTAKTILKYCMYVLKYFPCYFAILLFLCFHPVKAQLLNDKDALKDVKAGISSIYNFEFRKAEHNVNELKKQYPGHPVIPLLQSFRMYWEFLPIQNHPKELQLYIKTLQECLTAIDKYFGADSQEPEAVFYTIAARGYLAMCYNYQNELLKAALEAKKAYNALIRGQSMVQKNPEFYFTSGLYNYYMEVYPEKKPIIKPVIWFFKKGSKTKGVEQLGLATQKAIISNAEACFYLVHILLEYENRPATALQYIRKLNHEYPDNPVYRMVYIETLLHNAKYSEAEKLLKTQPLPQQTLYHPGTQLFQAYLAEKFHHNLTQAETLYNKTVSLPVNEQFTSEYHALAYAGLGRISHSRGNYTQAKEYYKKCLKTAEYKSVVQEANEYLKK